MTTPTREPLVGLAERLREQHDEWQLRADGWLRQMEAAGQPADAEQEATIRNTLYGQAATALEEQSRRVEEQQDMICYLAKWVERGLFDQNVTAKEALCVIAHYPAMPFKTGRWDVDHKPYAEAFYRAFPRARTALSPSDTVEKGEGA